MTAPHVAFAAADDQEDLARAETYGLLSRLWLAPPDAALLEQFRVAVTEAADAGAHLAVPWHDLVAAMRETTVEAARDEFDALFLGVGKPEIVVYASYHIAGVLHDRPLARLRDDLATLGLARDESRGETEDHVAFLFEVMRYLIAGDDAGVCNLEQQRRFFRAHLQPWTAPLCDSVDAHPRAALWRAIAAYTRAYCDIETQAFDMLET